MKKLKHIAHEIFLSGVCIAMFFCAKPISPPGTITLSPDAAVSDIFTGFVADCSDLLVGDRTAKVNFWVQSCMDMEEGPDTCMVRGAESFTKDAMICLLIDMNVQWQRDIANGFSDDQALLRTSRANRWFRDHQIGSRR